MKERQFTGRHFVCFKTSVIADSQPNMSQRTVRRQIMDRWKSLKKCVHGATLLLLAASAPGQTIISNVSLILPEQTQTITISGSGFGTKSPYNGDSTNLYILDVSGNWEAGYQPAGNEITLNVTSWTDNQIVISGFGGQYGNTSLGWTLESGDAINISIWNPQTGSGPATYSTTVSSATSPGVFSANPSRGQWPLTVQFNAPATDSSGTALTQWNWDFGDGVTSTAQNPVHVYTSPGTFAPALSAKNSSGTTVQCTGPSVQVTFQPAFNVLREFAGQSDGEMPYVGLSLSGDTIYGTTYQGYLNGTEGALFSAGTNGAGFTVLHGFTSLASVPVISGRTIYVATIDGGAYNNGSLFKVNTDGTGFTDIYDFPKVVRFPSISVIGDKIYGTLAEFGGTGNTEIFKINTDGSGYTVLCTLSNTEQGLLVLGNKVYGTTQDGGVGSGSIFSINIDGTSFQTLHNFAARNAGGYNSEGFSITGPLVVSGNTLYGIAESGGTNNNGTIFKINTDGSGFAVLHSFADSYNTKGFLTGEGAEPNNLVLSGNILYGTAYGGGGASYGAIFSMNTDGTGFTVWHSFGNPSVVSNVDGLNPIPGVALCGNTLFGECQFGGTSGFGTVFAQTTMPPAWNYPQIISQTPSNSYLLTANGATETLSVAASGPALQYQWFSNSGMVSGATNASLNLSNITPSLDGSYYWAVVSNAQGSVNSGNISLYVVPGARRLPSGYWPDISMTNTLKVGPPSGTLDYAVQDQISGGNGTDVAVSDISDGGSFDATSFTIKWGPFFDDSPRTLTYVLTPSSGITNWLEFSGIVSFNGTNSSIEGDSEFNLLPLHPADNGAEDEAPIDNHIGINEMTAYGNAWKAGDVWSVVPNPIPISYVTSAGQIWKLGEFYTYNPSLGAPPACWAHANPPSGAVQNARSHALEPQPQTVSAGTAVCSMPALYTNSVPFTVTLTVTPANDVNVYAVEDEIPADWTATNFSASGVFDSINNMVKWGPFFDNSARTLTYEIIPPVSASGSVTFSGTASFDGTGVAITGVRNVKTDNLPLFFADEVALSGNWYYLGAGSNQMGFGYYSKVYFPYIFHLDMGWEYFIDANNAKGGGYFYDFSDGAFFYTEPGLLPYLYDFKQNAWLYYEPQSGTTDRFTSNPRWFRNMSTGVWGNHL